MGELGDWGYWLLFIIMAFVFYVWGYANGYTEGKKDGQKEKRHIDAITPTQLYHEIQWGVKEVGLNEQIQRLNRPEIRKIDSNQKR